MKQKPVASEEKRTWPPGTQSIYSNCLIFNAFALSHPLSRQILNNLSYGKFYPISKYKEVLGKGIRGLVNNQMVYAGNQSILPHDIKPTQRFGVHIVINSTYKGTFIIAQQWRLNLSQLINKLEKHFSLKVLSGDTNKDEKVLKSFFLHQQS